MQPQPNAMTVRSEGTGLGRSVTSQPTCRPLLQPSAGSGCSKARARPSQLLWAIDLRGAGASEQSTPQRQRVHARVKRAVQAHIAFLPRAQSARVQPAFSRSKNSRAVWPRRENPVVALERGICGGEFSPLDPLSRIQQG